MKRLLVAISALGLALSVGPVSAEATAIVAVVSAESEHGCLTIAGAVAGARSRWFAAWYPDAALTTPAGPCPETEEHVEPPVVCVAGEVSADATSLYLAARGPDRVTWLYRVVDSADPDVADSFAVAEGAETEDRCGAAELVTAPVAAGSITLLVQ